MVERPHDGTECTIISMSIFKHCVCSCVQSCVHVCTHQAMESNTCNKFLIDGFPRNEDNLAGWERQMDGKADVKFVLFFECPEEVSLAVLRGWGVGERLTHETILSDMFRESFSQREV